MRVQLGIGLVMLVWVGQMAMTGMELEFGDRKGIENGGRGAGDGADGNGARDGDQNGDRCMEIRMGRLEMVYEKLRRVQAKVVELGSMRVELEVAPLDVAGD